MAERSDPDINSMDARITRHIADGDFANALALIWQHTKLLTARIDYGNRKIIKVDRGDLQAFVYEGDYSARPTALAKHLPGSRLSPQLFIDNWEKSGDILLLLVAWYAAGAIPTAFLDIGSNIGSDAIRVAKFSRIICEALPIWAFEPGVMAALVPYNLRLNRVEDLVHFEDKCVSSNNDPIIIFGEPGFSPNNRIVNREPASEGFNKIVDATTVAECLAHPKLRKRHPIIKVDTQGAEWLVGQGMKEEVSRRWFSMVIELTPWALRSQISPSGFVTELLDSFFVFDIGFDRQRFVPISAENLGQVLADVMQNRPYWTDLLCLSRALPSVTELIGHLRAGYTR